MKESRRYIRKNFIYSDNDDDAEGFLLKFFKANYSLSSFFYKLNLNHDWHSFQASQVWRV